MRNIHTLAFSGNISIPEVSKHFKGSESKYLHFGFHKRCQLYIIYFDNPLKWFKKSFIVKDCAKIGYVGCMTNSARIKRNS